MNWTRRKIVLAYWPEVGYLTSKKTMARIIAGMNMTVDGYCDHTSMIADEELHQHYTDALKNAGTLIYGRTTYQMMESYWPTLVKNPSGKKDEDDFAVAIDNIQKVVYSHTLNNVTWKNSILKKEIVKEELLQLKKQSGKDIFVGSPSLIVQLANLGVVEEFQLGLHPTIVGHGLPLFKNINDQIDLKFVKTKPFRSGVMIFYYETKKK